MDRHPSQYRRATRTVPSAAADQPRVEVAEINGERADCCSARPLVRVVLPRTEQRPAAELFFCGHHRRASAPALRRLNASVFDATGRLVY